MTINNPLTLNKFNGKYSNLKPKLLENINKTIQYKCNNVFLILSLINVIINLNN